MKILIVAVTYNSYPELRSYLSSIEISAEQSPNTEVTVRVADNSINKEKVDITGFKKIKIEICPLDNKGYLGGAQDIINTQPDIYQYDYVAISNVDIVLSVDFFKKLQGYTLQKDVAWLATKIWSKAEGRDRNPKIVSRPGKIKLQIVNFLYRFPILDFLYTKTLYKRKTMYTPSPEIDIYAGHGSFMMLTKHFFMHYKKIEYPIFLFGEELYLAELIHMADLRVRYVPGLEVIDMEHASTGKMKKAFYYKCNKESIDYILENFYNE